MFRRARIILPAGFSLIPFLRFQDGGAPPVTTKPALKPAGAESKPAESAPDLDFDETKKLVSRFRETDHWALKAIILISLGPKWHPVAADMVEEALNHKDTRLRAYAVEALLRSDLECLKWGASADLITLLIQQIGANKNPFYQEKLLAIAARLFPTVREKATNHWKPSEWKRFWDEAKGSYAPAPWVGPASRPARAAESTKTTVERFLTRAVDLNIAGLDVAICIDSTGSMQPTINAARSGLSEIVSLLKGLSPKFRLGLVHYKDLPDMKNGAHVLSPLTAQVEDVQEMLNKLIASGGGDLPESVEKGLEITLDAYTMGWTPQANKVIIIIGDAPPHPADVATAIDLAKKSYEKPFNKDPRIPADLKTDKSANRPFITSTIAINGTPDTLKAFQQIANAGGGMCGGMTIAATAASNKNGGAGDATKNIVQHILTLTFGRQWAKEAAIFVSIYQDYRRGEFIK